MGRLLCKLFGHKWSYFFVHREVMGVNGQDVRVCKRCNQPQAWTMHITGKNIWSNCIWYKDKGAKEHVKGYGIK